MKNIILITLFLSIQLWANYAISDEKTVKIDMHGGKSEQFSKSSGFSKMGSKGPQGLNAFIIKKPKEPTKPEEKNIPELDDIELK